MTVLLSMAANQHLSISPRMQQAIRLLRLSSLDFELALRSAVASNPFLEEVDETPDEVDPSLACSSAESPESFAFERPSGGAAPDDAPEFSHIAARVGLREHLRSQLQASCCGDREMLAANVLIEMLDDDGYLRDSIEESLDAISIDTDLDCGDIERAMMLLRQFDPPGIGARTLVECLLLQLDALDAGLPGRERAKAILRDHIRALERRDYHTLQRQLKCSEPELFQAIGVIRRLDPEPGLRFSAKSPDYIVPDVLIVEKGTRHVAVLNPALRAGVCLNDRYVELFRNCRRSQHQAMAQQLQEARWMVRNIEQRFDTILRVASFIVERQQAYFYAGDLALEPMILREVSNELGLHESTVSRATGNKYMATARGCIEFKHFFSRELPMDQGKRCSAAAVRSLIGGLIGGERRSAPLSDVDITAELKAQGIHIARRTVTKYRRMLKMPSAEFRRVG